MDDTERPLVSFDAEGRVRVLDDEKFKATEELEAAARKFVTREFRGLYKLYVFLVGVRNGQIMIDDAPLLLAVIFFLD